MSQANIRRLLSSRKFSALRVPAGYDQNVGVVTKQVAPPPPPPDMSPMEAEVLGRTQQPRAVHQKFVREPVVEQAGFDLTARFQKAAEQMAAASKKKKSSTALDPLVEHLQTVALNSRNGGDGTPTVVADTAAALMALDQKTREMVMRRARDAGKWGTLPAQAVDEVFGPLTSGALPEPPGGKGTITRPLKMEEARARVDSEDKALKDAAEYADAPLIKKWSSHFAKPDQLDKKGVLTDANKSHNQYKKTKPRNISPMDVTADSQKSTRDVAIRALAGDQIRQLRAIQGRAIADMGLDPEAIKSYAQRDEIAPLGSGVSLGGSGQGALTIGTDPNYWKPGDRRKALPGQSGATTGTVIDRRNKGNLDRVVEMLYMKTQPKPVTDATTGLVDWTDAAGKPQRFADPMDTTIDLDRFFPWWRARFATADENGKIVYPGAMPTAEFITGLIETTHGVQDPGFFDRVLPLIQRSIDAAPDQPPPSVRVRGIGGKTAAQWANEIVLPSPAMTSVLKGGVGSKDMPYQIYGPRKVDRPPVEAPERHPFKGMGKQAPEVQEGVDEFRRLMSEPGLGDQSSIYRVPANSPMRFLLA